MISKILIANRGEIACRVIRTARRLGISTVAVYSNVDANAQHVLMADEAVLLGDAPAQKSYLRSDLILKIANALNVDAIHPGYGFLSENADFSRACKTNNIVFIGPGPEAIEAMGSKSAAKAIMERAEVPLVPGYHGDEQDPQFLHDQADNMTYPVLLKAAAGGGGKGMRQVWKSEDFLDALEAAKRESQSSFGDQHMLIEKYLTEPRHVEIQVFCDNHGNGVYLFERDCSVQRRHQKIIEEAPAPNITKDIRDAMGEAALKAAKAIGYSGAGTVEFLLDSDGSFYFMEMNTRLQVEHPVTEMITGEDLVEWQIHVANNLPLPKTQSQLRFSGHAFEARIYAEDPDNEFLPQTGTLKHLCVPSDEGVRVDTGVVQGDEVSVYYDPMISKLIVHGDTREHALAKLTRALHQYHLVGLTTNIEYLLRVAKSAAFKDAQLTTDFVERNSGALEANKEPYSSEQQAIIAYAVLTTRALHGVSTSGMHRTHDSVYSKYSGFRLNHQQETTLSFSDKFQEYQVKASREDDQSWVFDIDTDRYLVSSDRTEYISPNHINEHELTAQYRLSVQCNDRRIHASAVFSADAIGNASKHHDNSSYTHLDLFTHSEHFRVQLPSPQFDDDDSHQSSGNIAAPMNGTLVSVLVTPGDSVAANQTIAIVEAMKMEHALKAPFDAKVIECYFKSGDLVNGGDTLLALEQAALERAMPVQAKQAE